MQITRFSFRDKVRRQVLRDPREVRGVDAKDALRAREEYFRLTLETAHEAFVSINSTGVITAWNPQAETIFGWSAEEAVGRPLASTIIPSRFRDRHTQGMAQFLATGKGPLLNRRLELMALRRDGREFPVELAISAFRLSDEWVFNAFLHDISERKRLEEESTQFLELSPDLLGIGDLDGSFRRVNPAFETVLGYREQELVGQPYLELIHPDDLEGVVAELERIVTTGIASKDYEARIRCKDGSYRSVLWSAMTNPEEGLLYAAGKDITERKRGEEAQREIEVLERSNLELEQFAYDVSHDLAEPLRVASRLAGRLGAQHGDALPEEGRQLITSIRDNLERMQSLISALLAYSRAAGEPLRRVPVDCSVLVEETLELLSERIEEKGASVRFDHLPTVEADPIQLEQVFQNLLSNALKFGDGSGVEVHVGARREQDAWRFFVEDSGVGVDPMQAERVFEMFRRLRKDIYAGTGIGLSICKRVVERHGGRIWLEPARGGGSMFQFTIPDSPPE